MVIRLPSGREYSAQVEKENRWLPMLAPFLPLEVPRPLALGEPTAEYPWKWSVYHWIDGQTAAADRITDMRDFATRLAAFLIALHGIDTTGGPAPGAHNFHRGGSLAVYDAETRGAITVLEDDIDAARARRTWESALEGKWSIAPVWVHGDISQGNLLLVNGRLSAVLDFGLIAIGDPACDLSIAWTLFRGESRCLFRQMLAVDEQTWARGRAWTLWKALIVAAKLAQTNAAEMQEPLQVIRNVLAEGPGR